MYPSFGFADRHTYIVHVHCWLTVEPAIGNQATRNNRLPGGVIILSVPENAHDNAYATCTCKSWDMTTQNVWTSEVIRQTRHVIWHGHLICATAHTIIERWNESVGVITCFEYSYGVTTTTLILQDTVHTKLAHCKKKTVSHMNFLVISMSKQPKSSSSAFPQSVLPSIWKL